MTEQVKAATVAYAKSLGDLAEAQRRCGVTTVVASGYFSPAHTGHLAYLREASKLGYLVVVVNNDLQVGLKGAVPFMDQYDRLDIVSEFRCVNASLLSIDDDRSICRTLELIRPDILVNGGDVRSESDCREAAVCRRLGIRMEFGVGGTEKLRSSSELIRAARSAP